MSRHRSGRESSQASGSEHSQEPIGGTGLEQKGRSSLGQPEAESPRVESDDSRSDSTFAAGFTPTRSGQWVSALLVRS
jgi:hypothetical protein